MSALHDALRRAATPLRAEEGGWSREYMLDASFPGFAGHFPGHPILPAVVQLLMARMTLEEGLGRPLRLSGVPQAKFTVPLTPGEVIAVAVRPVPLRPGKAADPASGTLWECALAAGERAAARFRLRVEEDV